MEVVVLCFVLLFPWHQGIQFCCYLYSQFLVSYIQAVSFVVRNTVTAILLLLLKITIGMVENISVQYIIRLCGAGK